MAGPLLSVIQACLQVRLLYTTLLYVVTPCVDSARALSVAKDHSGQGHLESADDTCMHMEAPAYGQVCCVPLCHSCCRTFPTTFVQLGNLCMLQARKSSCACVYPADSSLCAVSIHQGAFSSGVCQHAESFRRPGTPSSCAKHRSSFFHANVML